MDIDVHADVVELTAHIVDQETVSGNERALADGIEAALRQLPWLQLTRDGDALVARTEKGLGERVLLAGHLDTVPLPSTPGARGTVPSQWEGTADSGTLYGRGASDMKGGVAVALALAARSERAPRDLTFVFYDNEEVDAEHSGLGRLARNHPQLLAADFGVLLEPTNGVVEGGCNGTLRAHVRVSGVAAHSARAWMGVNAIHETASLLERLRAFRPSTMTVEGLEYRESLNAVRIEGGVAGNMVPDAVTVEVNYRFAPDKTEENAAAFVRDFFSPWPVDIVDSAPAARPALDSAAALVAAVGKKPQAKLGWTDVARLSQWGIPAVNYGPGDPLLAHSDDEHVDAQQIRQVCAVLQRWLL